MDFTLEKWQPRYISHLAKQANNQKVAAKLRDVFPFPYTIEDARWYVNDCIEKEGKNQLCRAIVVNGEAVGSIGVFIQSDVGRKTAELGYWLAEPFWNQGIITRAIQEICKETWNKFDVVRIYATPFENNKGSQRVLEKAGFQLEGIMRKAIYKQGEVLDSYMYALVAE